MRYLMIALMLLTGCATTKRTLTHLDKGIIFFENTYITNREAYVFSYNARYIKENLPSGSIISIYIDSYGGDTDASLKVIETIKALKAAGFYVKTICTRNCQSMGAYILQYGNKRYAYSTALIMFHGIYYVDKDKNKIDKKDKRLEMIQHSFLPEAIEKTGKPESYWIESYKLKGDIYFMAAEALEQNIIDEVVTSPL